MGDVYWSVHAPLASRISKEYNIRYAIETGTFYGSGALQLAAMFEKVYTIESDPVLADFFIKNYGHISNIEINKGSSDIVLKRLLTGIDEPVLFFLDAHWFSTSPRSQFKDGSQCPITHELDAISQYLRRKDNSIIMIDDADMFLKSLPPEFNSIDFPSIGEILRYSKLALNTTYVDVMDDVIIAGPESLGSLLNNYELDRIKAGAPYANR